MSEFERVPTDPETCVRYCVVPGYDSIGEIPRFCEYLRRWGRRSLVVVNRGCSEDYAGLCDRLAYCDDMFSAEALTAALTPFRAELDRFVTAHDLLWPSVFSASIRLGIPFGGLRGQINTRIKPRMRALLASVCPVNFSLLHRREATPRRVREIIARIGVPFVIKPIWGQGSSYVEIVEDEDAAFTRIERTFAALAQDSRLGPFDDSEKIWSPQDEILLEAFIPGKEYSLEGFIANGAFHPLMIQEKHHVARLHGIDFETCNLAPTPLLGQDARELIYDRAACALDAVGLQSSFFHIEFKWDGHRFAILEINPRMGGGSVASTLGFWYGVKVWDWPLRLTLGETSPEVPRGWKGFLVGVFVNADKAGRFRGIEGLDWVHAQKGFVFETVYHREGQAIPDPRHARTNRYDWMYAYDAFFWCEDLSRIDALHNEVRSRVRIIVDPEMIEASSGDLAV